MSWWETLHLVTWWKRLGISAIKTGQDAPSWIWCTERLSFFGGGISFYSVSCMSDVIFNPSLLNWSSLILTVAHVCFQDHHVHKDFAWPHMTEFWQRSQWVLGFNHQNSPKSSKIKTKSFWWTGLDSQFHHEFLFNFFTKDQLKSFVEHVLIWTHFKLWFSRSTGSHGPPTSKDSAKKQAARPILVHCSWGITPVLEDFPNNMTLEQILKRKRE